MGFAPYAEALAAFLVNPATKAPLTISIEGRWGSGKSSFMRQLEKKITDAENLRRGSPPSLIFRFNAWRHEKQETLWAAFALEFLTEVRKALARRQRWRGDWFLFRTRFSWRRGWTDLIRKVFQWTSWLSAILVLVALSFKGPAYVHIVLEALTKSPGEAQKAQSLTFLDWALRLGGLSGTVAFAAYLFSLVKKQLENPLKIDLERHLKCPNYDGSVSFVEGFHSDFRKILTAYTRNRRVYVFIDDLDRCEVPRAADLMQAINLMIPNDPQLVFVIGMDWETVAAGIAVKNEGLSRYLKPEGGPPEGRPTENEPTHDAMELGRGFLEKFIQLRFKLPRPGDEDLRRLLLTLSRPTAAGPGYSIGQKPRPRWLVRLFVRRRAPAPENTEEGAPQQAKAEAVTAKLQELIEFGADADSVTIQTVALALMPAFDNNPRRLKQLLGLYRLRTYIAKVTGLFAIPEGQSTVKAMTLAQLGKFTALELRCPDLLRKAESDRGLLGRLERAALSSEPTGDKWLERQGVAEILRAGLTEAPAVQNAGAQEQWSLANLDVSRLVRVSPYVMAFDARIGQSQALHEPSASRGSKRTTILEVPRVPFRDGQDADFFEVDTDGLTGFNLRITVSPEAYWRCGFALAPEPYIREGRTDVTIEQYFLFHIGQGDSKDPTRPEPRFFQVYQPGRSMEYQRLDWGSQVEVRVIFGARRGHIDIGIGDKRYEADVNPQYLSHLYVLGWADTRHTNMPFRIPVEFTRLSTDEADRVAEPLGPSVSLQRSREMAAYTKPVDGKMTLAQQENHLNGLEQIGFSKVTKYVKQTTGAVAGTPLNVATLDDAPAGLHLLYLQSVDVGASTAAVIAAQKTAGRDKIFDGTAYVSGAEKTVLGFRQP